MDKFDQQIAKAKQTYEPKTNFVEDTMNQLPTQKNHRRWGMKFWAPAITGIAALAVIAFVIWPKQSVTTPSTTQTTNTKQTPANTPLTTGSDNASLSSDLNSIQSSLDQSTKDQTSADGAVNDNQNQITVPTN